MPFFDIITYTFSGSICLALALMLLFVRRISPSTQKTAYQLIRNQLAYAALLDVVLDIIVLSLFATGNDIFILDAFVVPIVYSVQLCLITKALLNLIHAHPKWIYSTIWFSMLVILLVFYVGGFAMNGNEYPLFSIVGYKNYVSTPYAQVLCFLLYALIMVIFVSCVFSIVKETILYTKKLNSYYSGNEIVQGRQLVYISYCFLFYFLSAGFDFLYSNEILDTILMFFNTFLFFFFVVYIANMQSTYVSTIQLESFDVDEDDEASPSTLSENNDTSEIGIIAAIHQWEKQPEKPYLKDGLLIADVAQSLSLTDMQLSFVLNHSLKMNFNTWINTLRIEESKRLMTECPGYNLSKVALLSGYSDLASFSKNFKKLTGESPSVFRSIKR